LVLVAAGILVPRDGGFPCIVKPADEDGSAGIDDDSICTDRESLARASARIRGPIIVEEFLPGREFVVTLWGERDPEHASIGEFCFRAPLRLNTYSSKWDVDSVDFDRVSLSYDPLEPALREALMESASRVWRAVAGRGYLRIDFRLDAAGLPRVLDVNPNSELVPGTGVLRAVEEAGWTWQRFVRLQVEWA
jgi:D-alanine-D-alanine ligase